MRFSPASTTFSEKNTLSMNATPFIATPLAAATTWSNVTLDGRMAVAGFLINPGRGSESALFRLIRPSLSQAPDDPDYVDDVLR